MANNTLTDQGIATGQVVQASEITQFVNAFTGVPVNSKGYDITISGSLNLTGSLLMTGSFINEFSGQFASLGLGVVAPTAPTMLHIKDTAAGGDPIVLLEGNAGTDNARIRFSNSDVSYDLGAYGSVSPGDSFQIVQDAAGSALTPFIIGKDTPTETFQIYNGILGIGMSNFSSNTSNLPAGSIQAENTISSSLVQGLTISASGAGVGTNANIYGTASQALYAGSAGTVVGGVNLGSIVMTGTNTSTFSASGDFNSSFDIVSNGGTVQGTYMRFGIGITDIDDNPIIVGKADSAFGLRFGDTDAAGSSGGIIMNMQTEGYGTFFQNISAPIGWHSVHVDGNITGSRNLIISGSGTPEIIVGPPATAGSNSVSSSLSNNHLEFYKSGIAEVSNTSANPSAKLNFNIGGNNALSVSSSKDVQATKQLIVQSYPSDQSGAGSTQFSIGTTYEAMGGASLTDFRGTKCYQTQLLQKQRTFQSAPTSIFDFNPTIAAPTTGTILYTFDYNVMCLSNQPGVGMGDIRIVERWKRQVSTGFFTKIGGSNQIYRSYSTVATNVDPVLVFNGTNTLNLMVQGDQAINQTLTYGGIIKINQISFNLNPAV